MDITVKKTCGRCSKVETREMPLTEANDLEAKDIAMDEVQEGLEDFLNNTLDANSPAIIVATKDSDGTYTVKSLRGLCQGANTKRGRGCAHRVDSLLGEIFEVKKVKKKVTAPVTEEETSEETTETGTE